MSILAEKTALRAQSLAARRALSPDFTRGASLQLHAQLAPLLGDAPRCIAGYCATNAELDVFPALSQLAAQGHTLCLPVVAEQNAALRFRRWQVGDPLQKDKYHIDIPSNSSPEAIPDTLLVPLVAFDRQGGRLGYGKGYYDRTIATLRQHNKSLHIIGVAYSTQCVERIPMQPHDERLPLIVTERESIHTA
jgi:5-formyltetrahydrofolate cyclo-ligase